MHPLAADWRRPASTATRAHNREVLGGFPGRSHRSGHPAPRCDVRAGPACNGTSNRLARRIAVRADDAEVRPTGGHRERARPADGDRIGASQWSGGSPCQMHVRRNRQFVVAAGVGQIHLDGDRHRRGGAIAVAGQADGTRNRIASRQGWRGWWRGRLTSDHRARQEHAQTPSGSTAHVRLPFVPRTFWVFSPSNHPPEVLAFSAGPPAEAGRQ